MRMEAVCSNPLTLALNNEEVRGGVAVCWQWSGRVCSRPGSERRYG